MLDTLDPRRLRVGFLCECVLHGFHGPATTAASGISALASVDDAMSCAPVCFNRSLAPATFSDVSQCTDNRIPPALMCPSYRLASYSGIPIPTSAPITPPTAPPTPSPASADTMG